MLMSSAGRPGDVCRFSGVVDLVEDLGGIGAVMRLEHGLEPLLAEEGVGGIHGVGQAVGVDHQRFARLEAIGVAGRAVDHADAQHPGVGRERPGPVGPDDDRRRVADPRVADQPGLLVGDQVEPRAEIALRGNTARSRRPARPAARPARARRSTAGRPAP